MVIPKNKLDIGANLKKLLFFTITILTNFYIQAQMVNSSLFGEMKALNPAVLSERKSGQITTIVSKLAAKKTQDIDGTENKVNIDITDFSLYRGGKGGGQLLNLLLEKVVDQQKE